MGILKRLSVALGIGGDAGVGEAGVVRLAVDGPDGPATLLVRKDPTGVTLVAVDGRFVMRLNLDAPDLPGLVLDGADEEITLDEIRTTSPEVSSQAVDMASRRMDRVIEALKSGSTDGIREEVREGLLRADIGLRWPARADLMLAGHGGDGRLGMDDCRTYIECMARTGILDVRFVSPGDLGGTPIMEMARVARDAGLVTGVLVGARRVSREEVVPRLAEAGVSYLELIIGEAGKGYDRGCSTALLAARTTGIEVVGILCLVPGKLRAVIETMEKLAEGGVLGVGVTAMIAAGDETDEGGLAMSLAEYREALDTLRARASQLATGFIEYSPLWVEPPVHNGKKEILVRCTGSDNAPAVAVDGSIRPCLHSNLVMGHVGNLAGPGSLPAPIRTITDQESARVDRATLCLRCVLKGSASGDRREGTRD